MPPTRANLKKVSQILDKLDALEEKDRQYILELYGYKPALG